MAYTIISQNNTTTTLSDENGNVITVPARVTLATSTDYTITKVNNNSVDLVDGNGKVIRGVPACVVLAGEGGGSGESYLPLTGGTLTGDLEMSNSKVQLHNTSYTFSYWLDAYLSGHLRIGKSSSVATGDLFISTGSGGDKSIAFGESGGSVGSADAKLEYIYTQKLSNGSDITVPTTGGTMAVQVSALPIAASTNVGEIYQYIGATDSTYTNGHFYKCVSDGQEPATYSWTRVDVQPTPSGLPDQTGQSGKFLTTDGTDASWSDKPLVNNATGTYSLAILGTAAGGRSVAIGESAQVDSGAQMYGVAIGYGTRVGGNNGIAIGRQARATAVGAVQIGNYNNALTDNSDANTFKVANANGNFEIMSADGTIPADRLTHAINKYSTMPTASASNEGWIVQFTGTTDSTYTHGYLYECKAQGTDPETYAWEEVSLGGGGGLPDQTGQSGKFLTTDGTDASWSDKPLVNKAVNANSVGIGRYAGAGSLNTVNIGVNSACNANYGIAVGYSAQTNSASSYAIAIGNKASTNGTHAIQLGTTGSGYTTNSDANTFKVANANGNFELMNANGNLPADRLASTTGLADGNYRLRLVMASGVPTLEWVAE